MLATFKSPAWSRKIDRDGNSKLDIIMMAYGIRLNPIFLPFVPHLHLQFLTS